MKTQLIFGLLLIASQLSFAQDAFVEVVGQLPEKVSNNAVCEGFVDGTPYIYSFGGIDSTLTYTGIHLRSFRYNVLTGESEVLPDMPDTLGKIAAAANRIGDIIYIIGGYHVFADGTELSSTKVHRFDVLTNQFLDDGADIPVAIDDQVQAIWRDSLIYVVTGWSDTEMVTNVQIYNPSEDEWLIGESVPDLVAYKAFGASGGIWQDTIYYFGGAVGSIWSADSRMRKGVINGNNPSQIDWSIDLIDPTKFGYRMAVAQIGGIINWIGGSNVTYNYDGIAYNGSGAVSPNNRILSYWAKLESFEEVVYEELPMDLRGIGRLDEFNYYICGGMLANQEVTDKIYHLHFALVDNVKDLDGQQKVKLYPNPVTAILHIDQILAKHSNITVSDAQGNNVTSQCRLFGQDMDVSNLMNGVYFLSVQGENGNSQVKFIVEK